MQFADWILPLMLLSSEDAHGRTAVEVTSNTAASSPHLEAPAPPAVAGGLAAARRAPPSA